MSDKLWTATKIGGLNNGEVHNAVVCEPGTDEPVKWLPEMRNHFALILDPDTGLHRFHDLSKAEGRYDLVSFDPETMTATYLIKSTYSYQEGE